MATAAPGCGSCKFWLTLSGPPPEQGLCRRFPPQRDPYHQPIDPANVPWTYPITVPNEWCGEYSKSTGVAARDKDE